MALVKFCSGAPCPTDYPLRSVSGRFGSAVVSRDCSCVEALSHLLDARQRARVFETLRPRQNCGSGCDSPK